MKRYFFSDSGIDYGVHLHTSASSTFNSVHMFDPLYLLP